MTDDRDVGMHNDAGRCMFSERVPKLGGLVEGNTLELRTWLIEVQNPIPEEDFISGRAFLKEVLSKPVRVQQRRAFKPLHPHGKRTAPAPAGPLHDPKAPNAVILADGGVPVVLDPCLSRRMRPHQVSGVKFLFNSVRSGGGAILADDMGLGKSLQAIALVWTMLRQGRPQGPSVAKAIIVCPASLVTNWVNEVKKWLGDDRLRPVAVSSGSSTFESKQELAGFINGSVKKLMIVSYEMFRSYADDLYRADVGLLVCDEGHRLKSSQGNKTIEALKKLPCGRRVILTGTPVQNDLEEFFAVCDFVNPGCLSSLQSFRSIFAMPIIASRDSNASSASIRLGEARARELGKVTSKFVLRRTASILERYLPAKLETAIFCRLQPRQEKAYEQEAQHRYADIDIHRFSAALSAINFLRKICSHPILAKSSEQNEDDSAKDQGSNTQNESVVDRRDVLRSFEVNDSSKMQIAMSICEASLVVGDKVIFVSNFTTTLDLVQYALDQRKVSFCRLDGSTPVSQRGDIVRRFNNGTLGDVFLLSAKAGGVGLNLIGANRLILFDPDWNPATDLQAMARVWRDGQKKRVFVYRLLSTGTIEEKIFQRQLFKGELQTALGSDSGGNASVQTMKTEGVLAGKEGNFSAEQLRDLFRYDGKVEFCETLQVLERSQIESKLESEFGLDDDFEEPRGEKDGLLKRFSQYKERFQAEKGVKDYIFCDEDDVLDKALNSDLATHGLVSYLYMKRSGKAENEVDEYQSSVRQKTKLKKRERGSGDDTPTRDDTVQEVEQKRRKLKPVFSDDARSDETEYESDPELAILEVMERSAARQRAKRKSASGAKTQKPQSTREVMKPPTAEQQDNRESNHASFLNEEMMVPKEVPAEGAVEIENTWDEAVQALEVDDITAFI